MDGLDSRMLASPSESHTPLPDGSSLDNESEMYLAAYLKNVPYTCESNQVMQDKLQLIVGRLVLCAKCWDWKGLSTWAGVLQCWLSLKYPLPKSMRIHLVKLCYELIVMPGADLNLIRAWADLLQRLIGSKTGSRPKLNPPDVILDWKPLWRILQKELWPKKRANNSGRNAVNLFLFVAEKSRRHYPSSEVPAMLDTFLPMFAKNNVSIIFPAMLSFLPLAGAETYLPLIFRLWEATNSSAIDDRIIELLAILAEKRMIGDPNDIAQRDWVSWKEVGIFTSDQWTTLVNKCLGSFHVPIASLKGPSNTGLYADSQTGRSSNKPKKTVNRLHCLAQLLVYSILLDVPGGECGLQIDSPSLGSSRALQDLGRIITSTESYFHPSNSGPWTLSLTSFVKYAIFEFVRRWKEEESLFCHTQTAQRLSVGIRRSFVTILRTPCFLAMFSKDLVSASLAQVALRGLAILDPGLIMPQLVERAAEGLEVINETHRTTAVLSTLSAVALPLVNESIWFGGQNHLLTLLDLSLPGIDMNDPHKTAVTALFISTVASQMKFGRVASSSSTVTDAIFASESIPMGEEETDRVLVPDQPVLSKSEIRQLLRDATFGFEEWVTSFFRQIFKLYENLPEEGGKSNKVGGKSEEAMLSSMKSALDIVCQHLSEELFDAVLRQTFTYASTTARANSIRAFGQLISSLARAHPVKTIDLFLPLCAKKIEEELEHGASSVRTTSSHSANPRDTVFNWYLTILRACLGYGGKQILKYKNQIMSLLSTLTVHTKNERGYSGTGRLLTRILHNVGEVYTNDERFVNEDEWLSEVLRSDHFLCWGKLYKAEEVEIKWHVPDSEETQFVIEILEKITGKSIDILESLLPSVQNWDNADKNDFCRHLHFVRSSWMGLATLIQEYGKEIPTEDIDEGIDEPELLSGQLSMNAGFTLTDPEDSRYQLVLRHRNRLGIFLHKAAVALRQSGAEDHIDAILQVAKAIDVHLLEYGITRSTYLSSAKAYQSKRDGFRLWDRQKQFPRAVYYRRAQYYHHTRLYMHSLFRGRSPADNELIEDLIEMSLSHYTRVRKYGQATLFNVCSSFARSTKFCLPKLLGALRVGSEPDRMKGALYTLGNKSLVAYALGDVTYMGPYVLKLLECSHQDKTSIQDLVKGIISECTSHFSEEGLSTDTAPLDVQLFQQVLSSITNEYPESNSDQALLERIRIATTARSERFESLYSTTVSGIIAMATKPDVHWKYVQYAIRLLNSLLRRNKVPSDGCIQFLMEHTISPEAASRNYCQKAIMSILAHIKMRTYSQSSLQALWIEDYKHPAAFNYSIRDPPSFLSSIQEGIADAYSGALHNCYLDKLDAGFLVWKPTIKAYSIDNEQIDDYPIWEKLSSFILQNIDNALTDPFWIQQLFNLWGQESNRANSNADVRGDNYQFFKMIAKFYGTKHLEIVFPLIEQSIMDGDKFKQRAGVEVLLGYLRGSKHWSVASRNKLVDWTMQRLPKYYGLIKPDTRTLWDTFFHLVLSDRDPRRLRAILDWIFSLHVDFKSDSAFSMRKALALVTNTAENLNLRFKERSREYLSMMFEQCDNSFAEIREQIALSIEGLTYIQWQPGYKTAYDLLQACGRDEDPLHVREVPYMDRILAFAEELPRLRPGRFPPPRVSQSSYDRTSLTLLQWFWNASHGQFAPTIFSYIVPLIPEIFLMTELSDNAELVKYSTAVLFILPAITPLPGSIELVSSRTIHILETSQSWRVRQNALLFLLVFFYRNLASFSDGAINQILNVFINRLSDENLEVRNTAAKVFTGVVRSSQQSRIPGLRERFISQERNTRLPKKSDPNYAESMLTLHAAILGLCALVDCFPYVVEDWMPPLIEVLARHSADRPPISTTIRSMASDFKKTHQDTWQTDKLAFTEDELQALNTILVGTSYYA